MQELKPKWRNGAGMALILLLIAVWSVAVASVAPWVAQAPFLVEMLFYIAAGIGWVFPVRPLLTWMETGSWRRR
jgi:predicted membrane channel-forming protein YqfA (hemolysin III family)